MNEQTRRRLGTLALCLGLAALHFILLLTAVHRVGTDAGIYFNEQRKAGVSEEGLRKLDHRMAAYLSGDAAALEEAPPFNAREMIHMRDCYNLFSLLRRVRVRLIPWAVALTLGGAWLLQDRKRARRCALIAPLIVLVPLGIFAVFAAVNFDAAFTLFHKLLFRNDLWLLDPRTDLLIRICPESMFMNMGLRIALYGLAGMALVTGAALLLTHIWPGGKEENPWKTTTRRAPAMKRYDFKGRERR